MRRVRRHVAIAQAAPPIVVERLHPGGIARIGHRRRHILQPHLGPDAVGVAKGIEAGFLGNAGAGEDDYAMRFLHALAARQQGIGIADTTLPITLRITLVTNPRSRTISTNSANTMASSAMYP